MTRSFCNVVDPECSTADLICGSAHNFAGFQHIYKLLKSFYSNMDTSRKRRGTLEGGESSQPKRTRGPSEASPVLETHMEAEVA